MVIVLDCNIWVSLTINSQIDFIVTLTDNGIEIASCVDLKNEIIDVLSRPKLSRFIDINNVEEVGQFHDLVTKYYVPGEIFNIVSDAKDNYLFALCLKAKAEYFVTGDKLLLKENTYKGTKIITLATLKQIVKGSLDNRFTIVQHCSIKKPLSLFYYDEYSKSNIW